MELNHKKKKRLKLIVRNGTYSVGFHPEAEDEPAGQEEAGDVGETSAPAPASATLSIEDTGAEEVEVEVEGEGEGEVAFSWGERYDYREFLRSDVEEFYNQCHDPQDGSFCEGADGPGRIRDNTKKSEETVGKKAPQYMKDMISRKRGAAVKKGADLLPKGAPQHMKDLMKRKMEESVAKKG